MPTGYAGEGKTFSKKLGKWLKTSKTKTFDYQNVNKESAALIISVFRWYPDYFCDIIRDYDAWFKLELPQRFMMRVFARYRNTYGTGVRGLTKTYTLLLTKAIMGVLFPGIKIRYVAPNQKQAAALATQAYHEIEKSYSILTQMYNLRNDRTDMFRITTQYGSEFTMYTSRGDNITEVCGEECGQEGENSFPIDSFITEILPAVRLGRRVNQKVDHIYGDSKHTYIGNACSKTNKAYLKLRKEILVGMLAKETKYNKYENFAFDISWEVALLCNLRGVNYFKDLKATLSPDVWLRECGARYTGVGDSPMLSDEVLSKSRRLVTMEERHCGDSDSIYIVVHDDATVDRQHNAKCADVVIKLTKYSSIIKRDKYRKQVVYADSYSPPSSAYLRAKRIKETWAKYCLPNGKITYLVIDARNAGIDVVSELMKPMNDGMLPLSCLDGYNSAIEQTNAIRCVYPMQSSRGGQNNESAIISYAQGEFEQGNVELLVPNIRKGIESYKTLHGIKDDMRDSRLAYPYRKTDELCQQIQNLKIEASGNGIKEKRKSSSLPRDLWSALKYGLWLAHQEEMKLLKENYHPKSSLHELAQKFKQNPQSVLQQYYERNDERSRLLSLRKR